MNYQNHYKPETVKKGKKMLRKKERKKKAKAKNDNSNNTNDKTKQKRKKNWMKKEKCFYEKEQYKTEFNISIWSTGNIAASRVETFFHM